MELHWHRRDLGLSDNPALHAACDADADADAIHDRPTLDPAAGDAVAPDCPTPIVDHATRREAALVKFERA